MSEKRAGGHPGAADRADEIAREIGSMIPADCDLSPHAPREIEDAIAAALRACGDELLAQVEHFVVEADARDEVRRDLRKRVRALKSTPSTETQERT